MFASLAPLDDYSGGDRLGSSDRHAGSDDHHGGSSDPLDWLRAAIRGEPGVDYPIYSAPPDTSFSCSSHQWPGYYADLDTGCQAFHICQADGRENAFLCPNGTIFSQENLVCVWWFDFDCNDAPQFYSKNSLLYTGSGSYGSRDTYESGYVNSYGDTKRSRKTTTSYSSKGQERTSLVNYNQARNLRRKTATSYTSKGRAPLSPANYNRARNLLPQVSQLRKYR